MILVEAFLSLEMVFREPKDRLERSGVIVTDLPVTPRSDATTIRN